MRKLKIFLILFILLLPTVSATRDKIKFNLDIYSFIDEDNQSKFNLTMSPYDDRDMTIEDEDVFTLENKEDYNETITFRFDIEGVECLNESLENILNSLSEKTNATYEVCKNTKQISDTDLATCENEKSVIQNNVTECSNKLSTLETNYNACVIRLSNETKNLKDCEDTKGNMYWFIIGALIVGFLVAGPFGGWDWWKGRREKKSLAEKETGRDIPEKGTW